MALMVAAVLSAGLMLLAISWHKTYNHIPQKELRRRAQKGDEFAQLLYSVTAYGVSLNILLWLVIGLSAAALFVTLNSLTDGLIAIVISAVVIWYGFAWMPGSRVSSLGGRITAIVSPFLAWLLRKLYPVLDFAARKISSLRPITVHTGLYQKEDIIDLIKRQQAQADNRITPDELRIVSHALTYGDKTIRSVMTPRRVVSMVSADDTIGPVLMAELHKSGHSRFPVYEGRKDTIVGTLYAKDLVMAKAGGKVSGVMRKDVYYVNEEASLEQALQAFLRTKHHLFMVVNEFEEIVGVITIEDVMEQVLGKKIVDEFDQYEDMRAVAKLHARQDRKKLAGNVIE